MRARDVPGKVTEDLLTSVYLLCGLRYDPNQVAALYRRLSMVLEDSSTYQFVLGKGKAQGIAQGLAEGLAAGRRATIRQLGAKRFGPPSATAIAALDAVADPDRLGRIADRLLDAAGWDDLLGTP